MTITWKKLGDTWAVQSSQKQEIGAVVTVRNRNNETKQVTLGACIGGNDWGYFYEVAKAAPRAEAQVGKIDGILAIFDGAAKRLKVPAVELSIPETGVVVRVNVATARAKVPGSLTITGGRDDIGERPWYGRILRDGTFQPSREAPVGLAKRLAQFAADPARIAAEHGKLTGRCCFCRLALTDGRSTAVGYGETCAANWGLPWGKAKATPANLSDGSSDDQPFDPAFERRA